MRWQISGTTCQDAYFSIKIIFSTPRLDSTRLAPNCKSLHNLRGHIMLLKLFDSEFGYHSIAGAKPYKHETRRRSGFHFARRDATRRPGCTDDECWPCAASRRSADRVSPSHTTHTSAVAANTHIMYAQYIAGVASSCYICKNLATPAKIPYFFPRNYDKTSSRDNSRYFLATWKR